MQPIRQAKINDELRRVLAQALRSLKDPRVSSLVSLTEVQVSGDLDQARCYVSIPGSAEEKERCLQVLKKAQGYLRTEISQGMRIRTVPQLIFVLDDSLERGLRIDQLIDEAMGRS